MEQTRFLGRYDLRFSEGSLAFENAQAIQYICDTGADVRQI